jgi:hypothetical protein
MQRPKIQSGHPATEKTHPNGTETAKEAQIQFLRRICVLSPAHAESGGVKGSAAFEA